MEYTGDMKHSRLERILVGILLVIAGGVVLHAPLSVWLGSMWPEYTDYIKAWKELLMGVALVLLLIEATRHKAIEKLLNDRLLQLAIGYAGLHFLMLLVFRNDPAAVGAGLLIDLRYVFYFALVYATMQLFPTYRRAFVWTFSIGAAVVLVFSLLQIFVLPKDILANIGYSKQTIAPYLTVDENPDYIRINSTLRGPNPLGAYVAIVIGLLAAVAIRWRKMNTNGWLIVSGALLASVLTLSASHSRSSVIGAVMAVAVVAFVALSAKHRTRFAVAMASVLVVVAGGLYALRNDPFVATVVLHDSPQTGAMVDSNTGHWESLLDGTKRMIAQPLGAGIGSTGSASLKSDAPLIIENQYLLIAHEVGWAGLALFIWLFVEIMRRLYSRRKSVLALGVFGGGVGLTIIGLLLPVWADDTVSIVWWGLAGVAVGSPALKIAITQKKKKKDA